MDDLVEPYNHVALRLPSEYVKIVQVIPNTTISLGKFGNFSANLIIGRPYCLTFEIQDKSENWDHSGLRVVPPSELNEGVEQNGESVESQMLAVDDEKIDEYEIVNPQGKVVMRTNKNIIDAGDTQKLTMEEIEVLKKEGKNSGKELVARMLESHSALDQKTAFSLAKYTLRKRKKYLRRFTVMPVDVVQIARYMFNEKEAKSIMELREEVLSLIMSWSNVHCGGRPAIPHSLQSDSLDNVDHNRWLVADETGGLIVAAMAERMGILYPDSNRRRGKTAPRNESLDTSNGTGNGDELDREQAHDDSDTQTYSDIPHFETDNTITLLHPATQPNLSILSYFSYDAQAPNPSHPLHNHLKTINWLQLLHPEEDSVYQEPPALSEKEIADLRSGRRSAYYRKRRRWARFSSIINETRAGGFTGLIVASFIEPAEILLRCVPLLRGGAQIVVYSPNLEPLVKLMDYYSSGRRSAFLTQKTKLREMGDEDQIKKLVPSLEFPVDPTMLLGLALHTVRVKPWQVLPGRTHPLMTGKGGAEGYIFVGTRVLPFEGNISARGSFKRRKIEVKIKEEEQASRAKGDVSNCQHRQEGPVARVSDSEETTMRETV